jgi:hypothetical protein
MRGVKLGEAENMNELAVAEAVFPPGQRQDARPDRECTFVTLEPVAPEVKSLGEQLTLATVNPLGRGRVCTIAVDAKSQVLRSTEGYKAMWTQILKESRGRVALNVDRVGQLAAQQLPHVLGVQIRPLSAVLAYLFLYLGLGVIGNWLFWNWLKRREMAWVSLVVISFCFTGYAMFSGTSGWEKSVDLQRIEVVQLIKDSAIADYDSFTGLLTSRTSTFTGGLAEEGLLVRDVNQLMNPYGFSRRGQASSAGRRAPFIAIQGADSSVDNFRVGARELRLAHVEGQVRLPGAVEGTITIDSESVHGRLRNYTGLTLNDAKLFLDGVFFNLSPEGDGWSIRVPTRNYKNRVSAGEDPNAYQNYNYSPYGQRMQISNFMNLVRSALFSDKEVFNDFALDPAYGAYVVGFTNETVAEGFVPAGEVNERISETLIAAPISVQRELPGQSTVTQLFVQDYRGQWRRSRRQPVPEWNAAYQAGPGESGQVSIRLPTTVRNDPQSILELDVFMLNQNQGTQLYLSPLDESNRAWHDAHKTSQQDNADGRTGYSKITYALRDWQNHISPAEPSTLVFSINATNQGNDGRGRRGAVQYQISARAKTSGEYMGEGGWQGWR